ncbi:DMT family transporter [Noviherbaspirillum galbum]|uniref:DMT family transporter n=1 Tax=Noviherbaspirillum galbum TaxID=2709383 RepID=A0A6B3SGW1_9BURK|nr:DMT family transporter [Noviherbaspirillum galbum]NEX59863.1 DMT family transporter [Noviherbaspirillum galbum]
MDRHIIIALVAAILFGASTPLAKMLGSAASPVMLAALLYLGSGIGLFAWKLLRRLGTPSAAGSAGLSRQDLPWLAGVIAFGGIAGPVLLMSGLQQTMASSAALLLNMEMVLTALLAWIAFREPFDRRIFAGMMCIVLAGLILSWEPGAAFTLSGGAWLIMGACLCWAIDNNLTRKISANDAVLIAGTKGLVAGSVNLVIALAWRGDALPGTGAMAWAALVGFLGYGVSLALFVVALRGLGTARTGAYASVAPFAGAAISLLLLHEQPDSRFWMAAGLMGVGIWLHVTERHEHEHHHDRQRHAHAHTHDAHHRHEHDFDWDGTEPHAHEHEHQPMTHAHAHFPDIHHRHRH